MSRLLIEQKQTESPAPVVAVLHAHGEGASKEVLGAQAYRRARGLTLSISSSVL